MYSAEPVHIYVLDLDAHQHLRLHISEKKKKKIVKRRILTKIEEQ